MRQLVGLSLGLGLAGVAGVGIAFVACSSSSSSGFTNGTDAGDDAIAFHPTTDGSSTQTKDTGTIIQQGNDAQIIMTTGDAGLPPADGSVTMTSTTTIYAHSDTELYSMDPSTKALTDIGTFKGMGGSYYDTTITDLAVDAAGEIYVCTEQFIYKVALPATPGAGQTVQLTQFLNTAPTLVDGGTLTTKYYALAFAPAGAIGIATIPSGETLVGGDSNGELWVFPATGAAKDVGNFGTDPNVAANFLSLSGDLVFYDSAAEGGTAAVGLATIRSCNKASNGKVTCTKTNDYLAGINMGNLKANASASGTPASLLAGIYGGTATTDGNGTGKAELFGLGAWQNDVYAFSRCYECYDGGTSPVPASLVQIDTTTGAATVVTTNMLTNGWSGAGVTTKVTVTVMAPPPTAPPK